MTDDDGDFDDPWDHKSLFGDVALTVFIAAMAICAIGLTAFLVSEML